MPAKHKKKPNYSQEPILYDHFGNPLEEVLKRDREREEKKEEELSQVAALVSEARDGAGRLLSQKFVVISCNIFLKIDSAEPVMLPAEVSLVFIWFNLGTKLLIKTIHQHPPFPGGRCEVLIGERS